MELRPATPSDAPALSALVLSFQSILTVHPSGAGAEAYLSSVTEASMRRMVQSDRFAHWVAEHDGEVVGFIAVRDTTHLYQLFVSRSHHRSGVARRLWERARSQAREAGNTLGFTVCAALKSVPVYRRFGFTASGPEVVQDGVAFLPMRLREPQGDVRGVIPAPQSDEIMARLAEAEAEHGVRILYACESGSRAWGFESPDSDFDVRFLYVRPEDWYLAFDVERRRDVIEYPIVDEIDCNGWDIRKALYLFTRTNGALFEWLTSPLCYWEAGRVAADLRDLMTRGVNWVALSHHYNHMARRNAREYLLHDSVRWKKYLYVLRPLLALRYIAAGLGMPPVRFQELVDAVAPRDLLPTIEDLLAKKRSGSEAAVGPPIVELNQFIASELQSHEGTLSGVRRPDLLTPSLRQDLNRIFRQAVADFESLVPM